MASIVYDGPYITSAASRTRLTPNFRAGEFKSRSGDIFVHRDLVDGIQMVRDQVGALKINSVRPRGVPRGHGVSLSGSDAELTLSVAKELVSQGIFEQAIQTASGSVVMSVPVDRQPSIKPVFAFDCGLQVVADYETRGDAYRQITGNFDGAGLSFGVIQFNFKSGTLQELFVRFKTEDEQSLQACFDTDEQYQLLWKQINGSRSAAIRWGDSLSSGRHKHSVKAPWKRIFQSVGQIQSFRRIQMEFAYERYGQALLSVVAFLEGLSGARIRSHRCLTALFDMCIQQGSHQKASRQIRKRILAEQPEDELGLTLITVEERAKKANKAYRADCLSRRLGICFESLVESRLTGSRQKEPTVSFILFAIQTSMVSNATWALIRSEPLASRGLQRIRRRCSVLLFCRVVQSKR